MQVIPLLSMQEGADLLGDAELGKTRGQTAADKEPEQQQQTPEKPKILRDSTMLVTAQVKSPLSLLFLSCLPNNYSISKLLSVLLLQPFMVALNLITCYFELPLVICLLMTQCTPHESAAVL